MESTDKLILFVVIIGMDIMVRMWPGNGVISQGMLGGPLMMSIGMEIILLMTNRDIVII